MHMYNIREIHVYLLTDKRRGKLVSNTTELWILNLSPTMHKLQ